MTRDDATAAIAGLPEQGREGNFELSFEALPPIADDLVEPAGYKIRAVALRYFP